MSWRPASGPDAVLSAARSAAKAWPTTDFPTFDRTASCWREHERGWWDRVRDPSVGRLHVDAVGPEAGKARLVLMWIEGSVVGLPVE